MAAARGDAAPELFPEEAVSPFLSTLHPRQDGPRTGQGGQGQDTTSGQSSTGSGGSGVEDDMSRTFQRIGNTYLTPYTPRSISHAGKRPVSSRLATGSHGELGASSAPRSDAQAARSTRMRAKSSMAARTCDTRSPASVIAAAAASPSMPVWARRCRVPSRTASSSPSRPSTA